MLLPETYASFVLRSFLLVCRTFYHNPRTPRKGVNDMNMVYEILIITLFFAILALIPLVPLLVMKRRENIRASDVRLVMTEHVDTVIAKTHCRPCQTVCSPDGNGVDMHGSPFGMEVLRSREDIDRICRHDSEWINALIKVELGSAARDLVADVYETADGHWNLAHIHNADFRGPDLRIRIAKGESLVKVGAGEFRFVISPVPSDLHDSPESAPSSGKSADHRQEPNNQR